MVQEAARRNAVVQLSERLCVGFERSSGLNLLHLKVLLRCGWAGWEAGIRTPITWSIATCPTVERPPNRQPLEMGCVARQKLQV